MNLASDILDKYTQEQVTAYLDKLVAGILKNYQTAIKVNQPQVLFSCMGDLAQIHAILKEMKRRDEEKAAQRQSMV